MNLSSKANKIQVFKRSNCINDFANDNTVNIIQASYYGTLPTSNTFEFINQVPLSNECKDILLHYSMLKHYTSVLRLLNPTIVIKDWGNGDKRFFLITESGILIEDPFQLHWDRSFPFIETKKTSISHSLLFRLDKYPSSVHNISCPLMYFPHVSNYSHFLLDAFSNLSILASCFTEKHFLNYRLPIINAHQIPFWQCEWIRLFTKSLSSKPLSLPISSKLSVIRCPEILLGFASSPLVKTSVVRNFVSKHSKFELSAQSQSMYQIIFFDRLDSRRIRVKNADQIKAYVLSIGGLVIDPSRLSFNQKVRLMSSNSIIIAESSGCMNPNIFSKGKSALIFLTDCETYARKDLAIAGWNYYLASGLKIKFLLGEDPVPIEGSTLSSCTYSLAKLVNTLDELRKELWFN